MTKEKLGWVELGKGSPGPNQFLGLGGFILAICFCLGSNQSFIFC
jgi:hypothetical protein